MNATNYRLLREAIGSRPAVARHLGISEATLARREKLNAKKISREAKIAITVIHLSGLRLSRRRWITATESPLNKCIIFLLQATAMQALPLLELFHSEWL
jgi:hypothetical protein